MGRERLLVTPTTGAQALKIKDLLVKQVRFAWLSFTATRRRSAPQVGLQTSIAGVELNGRRYAPEKPKRWTPPPELQSTPVPSEGHGEDGEL